MKLIPLTQRKFAMVDDADFEWLIQFKWYANSHSDTTYAVRVGGPKGQKRIYMHRDVARPGPKKYVDHIDGDGLNNQRGNLRVCSHAENRRNHFKKSPSKNTTSRFIGVGWRKDLSKWRAYIATPEKPYIHLGHFESEEAAARAYDSAAKKYFGEFAAPNFA